MNETKNLIRAQTMNLLNKRNIILPRDTFHSPSQLLGDGHDLRTDP